MGRDDVRLPAGLADTFAVGLLLRGQRGSETIYSAATITLQGEQVFVEGTNRVNLPLILRQSLSGAQPIDAPKHNYFPIIFR